jgi:SAM-dependent methyltransferase|tara:strand:+ start:4045 stop:4659 length:615 start_codon:yes stop_codon:yes gene_type:complete
MKLNKISTEFTVVEENHLGGYIIEGDPATYTPQLWEHLVKKYNANSVIDIGCGMGYALQEFSHLCDDVLGLEGSTYAVQNSFIKDKIMHVDFSKEKPHIEKEYDLCWACEFVEHVEEKYMENYLHIMQNSKVVAMTFAGVGQGGYHHVNEQPLEYWINKLSDLGLEFDLDATNEAKNIAYLDGIKHNPQYRDNHFMNRGLICVK